VALGALKTEADLTRFLAGILEQPGAVKAPAISGLPAFRYGVETLTFGGAVNFTTGTITHGFETTPQVFLTPAQASDGKITVANVDTVDETEINVLVQTNDGSVPSAAVTVDLYWLAVV